MESTLQSPCKVNLLLNILGKRPDGFHELETIMYPLNLCDTVALARGGQTIQLTCSDPRLPTDGSNLVYRAASAFLEAAKIREGLRIHLEKRIPVAAGLGGGSGNAATTLLGLNALFGQPLSTEQLSRIAASLGSDIPFFLQPKPALATGRGEKIRPLDFFPTLRKTAFLLIHPGFGIASAWAYGELARFPRALHGAAGRAQKLIALLQTDLESGAKEFYNSLEAPALDKFPILALYQEFLGSEGALAALMSGSGSTTFAIFPSETRAKQIEQKVREKFGSCWTCVIPS